MVIDGIFEVFILALSGFAGGMLGGALIRGLMDLGLVWQVESLRERVERMHAKLISPSGVEGRAAASAEMEEAIAKVALLIKEGKKPDEAIKEVAVQYPQVAAKIFKKMMKDQGLGGILQGFKL